MGGTRPKHDLLSPIGATISFNADVYPYTRTNGFSGFGLINIRNVEVEAEAGAYVAGADYEMVGNDISGEEFALTASESLLGDFDFTDVASGGLEQNIAVGAQRRTEKLNQRIQFNERLAYLALLLEEVTGQFLQVGQRAQAAAADLAQLEAEVADYPELEEERRDLQQLATRQRELAATYWRWQPPQLTEEVSSGASNIAASQSALITAAAATVAPPAPIQTGQPSTPPPLAATAVSDQTDAEQEDARTALRQMIAEALEAAHPNAMPTALATAVRQKASKRVPKPPAPLKKAALIDLPASIAPQDQPVLTAMTGAEQITAPATMPNVEDELADELLGDAELPIGKLDEAGLGEPTDIGQRMVHPARPSNGRWTSGRGTSRSSCRCGI
ncbi:MAG: hypothetical protein DLM69_00340 [Candidatus Chloroheliales bacterium]|nr:MAG: hypothetical protein DLM69_00340 [Chloroflexota bacterium]